MSSDHELALLLVDLAVLILLGRVFGRALTRLREPPVLGEIFAGVAIGPSLLGAVAPGVQSALFPAQVVSLLGAVGNVGLVIFVFLIGLEIDRSIVGRHFGRVAKVAIGSLTAPFVTGLLIAMPLYAFHSEVGGEAVPRLEFTLMVGIAFSVTAFPVLARILTAEGLERSALGAFSLAAAGVLDVAGWMMLAIVLTLNAGHGGGEILWTVVRFLAFAALAVWVLAPLAHRALTRFGGEGSIAKISILATAIFACAGTFQLIGLHSVIGALLLGVAFPRRGLEDLLGGVRMELYSTTSSVLLPVYFAIAGMDADLAALDGRALSEMALLAVVATVAKIAGTMAGARWARFTWREGFPLGVLMNTRGLMEVVVLNIGLSAGLLDESLYSELMLVALAATLLTAPVIRQLRFHSVGRLWGDTSWLSLADEQAPGEAKI